MKRPETRTPVKRQRPEQFKERYFLFGVQCGAKVSRTLIESGWTNMKRLEAEVLDRVRGR